jgi:hypothetical protein
MGERVSIATDLDLLRATVKDDASVVRQALTSRPSDVPGFLRFAQRNRLADFVYWRLQRFDLTGLLPPSHLAAAKAATLLERRRCERLVEELARLGELFHEGDVRVLFLKGPLLAQRFYGGLEGRTAADLDLFIRGRDLGRVEALLQGTGYAPAFHVLLSRRLTRYFAHHFEYRRQGVPLDVHWEFQRHFSFRIDYRRVWASASRVELGGRSYEVVSAEYELVLQLLGVLTDLQVGKLALRSLVDIHRIIRAVHPTTDWNEFFARRKRERILRPSAYVLALVLELLQCRGEFPSLETDLEPILRELPATGLGVRAALESRPLSASQKLLALRIYESPLAASLSWWLLSLPFRLAVYGITRPGRP